MAKDQLDENRTGSPDEEGPSLHSHLSSQFARTVRVSSCLAADAALFLIWLVLAIICQVCTGYAKTKLGVDDFIAEMFMWTSSVVTFLLASIYAFIDVLAALRMLLRAWLRK